MKQCTCGPIGPNSNSDLVKSFMNVYGQEVMIEPVLPEEQTIKLRYKLIEEELAELKVALLDRDIISTADALTDLLYVVYGAGHAFGINLDACFAEVHRSNMSKLDEDGHPIRREDGKILKSRLYSPPDLMSILSK